MPQRSRLLVVISVVLLTVLGGVGGAALVGGFGSSAPAPLPVAAGPVVVGTPAASSPTVGAAASSSRPEATHTSSLAGGTRRPPAPRATPELVGRLDVLLESLRLRHELPGVSASMIFPDGSTWTGASGMADIARGRLVSEDTAFAVASISKTFTAAVILDLVSEGNLGLEESVARRLPGLGIDPRVTVHQLLDHTSGLYDFFLGRSVNDALLEDRAAGWSARRSLSYMSKPYFPPGRGWRYSNTNYLLLGLIAEKVAGQPLATQIRRRYLDPLGLSTAYYQDAEQPRGPVAHGYRFWADPAKPEPIDLSDGTEVVPFRSVVSASDGAGSIAASSRDVARWARALYSGRATRSESLSLMLGGVVRLDGLSTTIPYGLGVQTIVVNGYRTYGHAGRFMGSRSVMRWLPGYDVTIAVLTNQSRVDANLVAQSLLAVVIPRPGQCRSCPMAT